MFYNNGTSFNYDQLIAYSVIPLMTSSCTTIITKLLEYIGTILVCLFGLIGSFVEAYVLKQKNEYSKVFITLAESKNNNYYELQSTILNDISNPFIWYINKKRGQHIGNVKLYKHTKNNNANNVNNVIFNANNRHTKSYITPPEYIYAPMSDDIKEDEKTHDAQCDFPQKNNKISKQSKNKKSICEIDKNIFMEHSTINDVEYIVISSKHFSVSELIKYLQNIKNEYDKHMKCAELQIYTFTGADTNKYHACPIDKSQNFNNLYFANKDYVLNLLNNFDDVEKYKKYGIKRKLSFCFVGKPGSGKTAIVTAMANKLNRNIVYIPISRLIKNNDLETIFYENTYKDVKYNFNEVIFFFDEIDSLEKKLTKNIENNKSKKEKNPQINIFTNGNKNHVKHNANNDEINTGILLNLLDGNYDQDGMIIIAAANDISNIDSAFVRNGRLKFVQLEYIDRNEIVQMIQDYTATILTDEEKELIRDDKVIQTLDIKECIIENINDIGKIIELINNMVKYDEKESSKDDEFTLTKESEFNSINENETNIYVENNDTDKSNNKNTQNDENSDVEKSDENSDVENDSCS